MNNFECICNQITKQKILCISVLIVTVFTITNFDIFAEELVLSKSEFSLGANHLGSMVTTQTVSNDGSIWIFVTATEPVEREHMTINVRFTDKNGRELTDVNYDIIASQNDQIILEKTGVNQHIGIRDHLTQTLPSNDNVSIIITLHEIGTDSISTSGESIEITVVPEFGVIAPLVLGISLLSIIIISTKNKSVFNTFRSYRN